MKKILRVIVMIFLLFVTTSWNWQANEAICARASDESSLVTDLRQRVLAPQDLTPQQILNFRIVEATSVTRVMPDENTYCNVAVIDFLRNSGVDLQPLGLRQNDYILANEIALSVAANLATNIIALGYPTPPDATRPPRDYTAGTAKTGNPGYDQSGTGQFKPYDTSNIRPYIHKISTPLEAQILANQGKIVLAVAENKNPNKHGHVAIVAACPNCDNGPIIGQAGAKVGFFNVADIFGKAKNLKEVKYYAIEPSLSPKPVNLELVSYLSGEKMDDLEGLQKLWDSARSYQTYIQVFGNAVAESRLDEFIKMNPGGLPPPPPPGAEALPVEIRQAIDKGDIEVETEGTGNRSSLKLKIKNKSKDWLLVGIPEGTTFNANSLNVQNMAIRKP